MYYTSTYSSPIGTITLAGRKQHLAGLWIENQKYFMGTLTEPLVEQHDVKVLEKAKAWLDDYFAGKAPRIADLSLAPEGSPFRQGVWQILCEIPYGEVITYGEIARRMAGKLNRKTMSGQAAGGAVAHNPISIMIPCHRVVGADGSLTGYAGGIERKLYLLELEGVDVSKLRIPTKGTAL